jgi:hypothetical protein
MLRAEQDSTVSIPQLLAEYDTIAAHAQAPIWQRMLTAAGLSDQQIADIEHSAAYGALSAALRDADSRDLPIATHLPALIAQRSLADAEDLAAVLHERVSRWIAATGTDPVVTATGITAPIRTVNEPDAAAALAERAALIERRADALVQAAMSRRDPWVGALGTPPTEPERRAVWLAAARTIAVFGDSRPDRTELTPAEFDAIRRARHAALATATPQPASWQPADVRRAPHL